MGVRCLHTGLCMVAAGGQEDLGRGLGGGRAGEVVGEKGRWWLVMGKCTGASCSLSP